MRAPLCLVSLLLTSCAVPTTIARLGDRCPPPEFGRPGWVRTMAAIGAWTGGVLGTAVSVVALPVTYPISVIAGDSLGEGGASEFLLFPAVGGAAFGHALFGSPPDAVDYMFRRAWTASEDPVNSYEIVPMQGLTLPRTEGQDEAPGT